MKSLLLLALCALPLLGQGERVVTLGDRVRVIAPEAGYGKLTGQVTSTTPDALSLQLDRVDIEVAVERAKIKELYLSVGSRRSTLPAAVIGGVIGGAAAFLWGPKKPLPENPTVTAAHTPATNVISAAIGSAAIGALVGFYTRRDIWVQLSPMRAP
jgi:hypothetical protein